MRRRWTSGVRWIWAAAQRGEVGQVHCGNAVGEQLLAYGEQVLVDATRYWGAHTGLGTVIKVRCIDGDFHDVLAGGHENLVYFAGTDGPDVV